MTLQAALRDVIEEACQASTSTLVICVSGAQGIGKTTALSAIAEDSQGDILVLGIDDFYLTLAQRRDLAERVHPLFITRGPPGTHDIGLLEQTLDHLLADAWRGPISLPAFDKRSDDRLPPSEWRTLIKRPQAIVIEGWLMGALPDPNASRDTPLNAVEESDSDGIWRDHQEAAMADAYAQLWDRADCFCHIKAPDFACVLDWRMQQERSNLGKPDTPLSPDRAAWVARFIEHYERITRRLLGGHHRDGVSIFVDASRAVQSVSYP